MASSPSSNRPEAVQASCRLWRVHPLRAIVRALHHGVPYVRYFGIGLIAGNSAPLPIISFTTAGSFATVALA